MNLFKILRIAVLVSVFLIISIFIPMVEASVPLGSAQDKKTVDALPGGSVGFKLFFYNLDEKSPVNLKLKADYYPQKWVVNINQQGLVLGNPDAEVSTDKERYYEYMVLPGVKDPVKVKVATVNVRIPKSAKPGKYTLKVSATASKNSGGVSASQVRDFYLNVNVLKQEVSEDQTYEITSENSINKQAEMGEKIQKTNKTDDTIGMVIGGRENILIPVMIIFVILIVSWIIYKHE
jgi:hypothetical protein